MERRALDPRPDWRERAEELGFTFHTPDGERYWDESAYYAFSLKEIEDDIEAACEELQALCLAFVARAVRDDRILSRLGIPQHAHAVVAESFARGDRSLYGRFDFAYDGSGPPKLLEYNADTPTALFETGVFQWLWLEDCVRDGRLPRGADQFNSVHERLVARLAEIAQGAPLHFTCMEDAPEDLGTVSYLDDCARQGGLDTRFVPLGAIGLRGDAAFVDRSDDPIAQLFKLYPWEWMFADAFGQALRHTPTRFLEPPWKAILSCKGLLPYLWEAAPGHPNLAPAFFEDDPRKAELGRSFVKKPLYSREGANVTIVSEGSVLGADLGPYGAEGYVRQAYVPLFRSDAGQAVIGAWMIGDAPAGLCVRESDGPITGNLSRFVPHAIA